MKRRSLIFLRIFIACLVLSVSSAFYACKKTIETPTPTEPSNNYKHLTEWSFESLDEIYNCFSMQSAFGRVSLNEDPQYVTDGKHSLKIEPLGTYNPSLGAPSLRIRLGDLSSVKTSDGMTKQGAYDFSKIKSISFDIFNMNEEAQTLSVRFVSDGRTTNASQVEVPVGKTENCTVELNVAAMQLTTDMSKATELNIYFPAVQEFEGDPYVFYIDNLKINFLTEEPVPYELIRDENEICSFEKEYQQHIMTVDAIGPASGCLPTTEINTDPQFSKDGKGNSLKVVFPTGTLPLNDGWPFWTFTTGFLESVDFKQYGDKDAYVAFDVYVPNDSRTAHLQTHFVYSPAYDEDGKKVNIAADKYFFRPTVGEWTEVVIPASLWSRFYDAENKPIDTKITAIRLVTDKFSGDPKTFYFDNFRFVMPDNRDMVGGEDFKHKTTDEIKIQGSEIKAQTASAKYVSASNAKPQFYGKYNGLRAGTEWVLAVHNNSGWYSELKERHIVGYDNTKVNIRYDDCNPFAMMAGDFGEIANLSKHTSQTASGSTIVAFNSLSELFATFMGALKDGAENAQEVYTQFYNKAIEIYNDSLVSFTKNASSDYTKSAVIGLNQQYTIAFDDVSAEVDLQKVIANLFGFSDKDEFIGYAQALADTYAQHRTNIKESLTTNEALDNGCFYTSNGSFVFPVAVKNKMTDKDKDKHTVLAYVILDGNGRVSVWVNDIEAVLWAINFDKKHYTNSTLNNVLCCKNTLFVTRPNDIYYEYDTSTFEFANEGDRLKVDLWMYTWHNESDWAFIVDHIFNDNWTLEFYKYLADGNYAKMIIIYNTPNTINLDESQGFSFYDKNVKMPYVIQNKKYYGLKDFRLIMRV